MCTWARSSSERSGGLFLVSGWGLGGAPVLGYQHLGEKGLLLSAQAGPRLYRASYVQDASSLRSESGEVKSQLPKTMLRLSASVLVGWGKRL